MLSDGQLQRLEFEQALLEKYFTGTIFVRTGQGMPYFDIPMKSQTHKRYLLRIYPPSDFPNSRPNMVVVNPRPLRDHAGKAIRALSSEMHVEGLHEEMVIICHYHPNAWQPLFALTKVAVKGRLWLEAYEGHIRTGQPIDHWLNHMPGGSTPQPLPSPPPIMGRLRPAPGLLERLRRRLFG